ncbi:MAG: dienelactone hydrolase family protein [Nocardioidaceae bacterium]
MTDIAFTTPAGERGAYLAQPHGEGPWPGVVIVHEIFGLNADMRALSDRLAAMGYLALAPDFYGGGTWWRSMRGALGELETGSGPFFDAIDAARAWLAADERCTGTMGLAGFSLGGGYALLAAARYPFSAVSVNYGEVPDDAENLVAGACPIIASYGGRDRTMRGRPEQLRHVLAAAGVEHDVKTYALAGHSFLSTRGYPRGVASLAKIMGMSAGPHAESAEDAWRRVDAFFGTHLRDQPSLSS